MDEPIKKHQMATELGIQLCSASEVCVFKSDCAPRPSLPMPMYKEKPRVHR